MARAKNDTPDVPKPGSYETEAEQPEAELEAHKEAQAEADKSPADRVKEAQKERAEQQKRAGQDPDDPPVALSGAGAGALLAPKDYAVGDKTFQVETGEVTQLNAIPTRVTATDPQGTDRIILPTAEPWKPREVEPDPREVARVAARQAVLEAKREERKNQGVTV